VVAGFFDEPEPEPELEPESEPEPEPDAEPEPEIGNAELAASAPFVPPAGLPADAEGRLKLAAMIAEVRPTNVGTVVAEACAAAIWEAASGL
jgi:hypothetical protein